MQELLGRSITSQIELKVFLAEDLWKVEIDPGDLGDTLVNLVNNARDAMPNGGELFIETANVRLSEATSPPENDILPGEYVLLTVSDNGHGMSKEVLERAFEPFFSTKPADRGTGLGLSMVYGFVRRSKGGIRIYSEENCGVSIRIFLPRANGNKSEFKQHDTVISVKSDLRGSEAILICDDESELAAIAGNYLESLGYRIILVKNANDALLALDEEAAIDLLFTDVIMPGGMNGFELIDAARQKKSHLRFLAASGYVKDLDSIKQHLPYFIAKPYKLEDLAYSIRNALDRGESVND
jgi:CheY-like chemotaxis protein